MTDMLVKLAGEDYYQLEIEDLIEGQPLITAWHPHRPGSLLFMTTTGEHVGFLPAEDVFVREVAKGGTIAHCNVRLINTQVGSDDLHVMVAIAVGQAEGQARDRSRPTVISRSPRPRNAGMIEVKLDEFLQLKVVPQPLAGRAIRHSEPDADDVPVSTNLYERDRASSWACQIVYADAKGIETERQISCKRVDGYGGPNAIHAFCHWRGAPRLFKIENIRELIDLSTGEVLDPVGHFEMLTTTGIMRYEDKAFTAFFQILLFMAKCDGSYHPLEAEALEAAVTAYCIRFNGQDAMVEGALARAPSIAPDGHDVLLALKRLKSSAIGPRVSRLILDHSRLIMDADGHHHGSELNWAYQLQETLKVQAA